MGTSAAQTAPNEPGATTSEEDERYEGPVFSVEQWLPAYANQREMLGFESLPTDDLRGLANSEEGQNSLENYGFVLTADERIEMDIREVSAADVHENLEPLAMELPGFAGVYANDQRKMVIGFTGTLDDDAKVELLQAAAYPDRVLIREGMQYTEAEIEQLAADMRERFSGVDGVSMNPEFESGIVEIKVRPEAEADALQVETSHPALRMFTDLAVGGDVVCTYRWNCHTYLRGGVKALNKETNKWCTTGFYVERNSNGVVYLMVNAHCGDSGDEYKLGNLTNAGQIGSSTLRDESLDTQGVITASSQSSYRFFRTSASKARAIQLIKPKSSIVDTDVVCVHSYKLARICGEILDVSDDESLGLYDTDDNFTFLINMPGSWGCTTGTNTVAGTSGAPVTSTTGHTLYGQQHTCTDATYHPSNDTTTLTLWASKAENIEDDLAVTILTGY